MTDKTKCSLNSCDRHEMTSFIYTNWCVYKKSMTSIKLIIWKGLYFQQIYQHAVVTIHIAMLLSGSRTACLRDLSSLHAGSTAPANIKADTNNNRCNTKLTWPDRISTQRWFGCNTRGFCIYCGWLLYHTKLVNHILFKGLRPVLEGFDVTMHRARAKQEVKSRGR